MSDEHIPQDIEVSVPDPIPVPPPQQPEEFPVGGPWRELGEVVWLSFPIIITMASYTVMQFCDVRMLGRHDVNELAAVMPASSCFYLLATLLMGTLSIVRTFVAQSLGRGRKRDAPAYVWQGIYLSLIWGAVALIAWPFAERFFDAAGHAAEIRPLEVSYFRIMLLRVPALGLWFALAGYYQATKRPVVPMIAALVGAAANILGNYALIFGAWGFPEMGITGAAIATVLASALQAAWLLVPFLGRRERAEYGTGSAWRFDRARCWQLTRFGFPAGAGWAVTQASFTLFFMWIIGSLGKEALAANNAAFQVLHLSFMPAIGLNIGVQAIVGHHIGMGDRAGAKRRAYRATGLAIAFMVTMGALFVIFRETLIDQFLPDDLAKDAVARVVEMGGTMLIIGAVFQAFDAVAIVSHGALKGAGDTRFPMFVNIICSWGVFVPLAWYLTQVRGMGVVGAWLPLPIQVVLSGGINFWRFASGAWRKIDIFEGERPKE